MTHLIIVKWKSGLNKAELLDGAKEAFKDVVQIEGCHYVKVYPCCIDRENRYDVMIEMDIEKELLKNYDVSKLHHDWKEKYEPLMDKKAIFDYE